MTTARLPDPGGDDNVWGQILNSFLQVAHNSDGTLQSSAVAAAGAYTKPAAGIPESDLSASVQSGLNTVSTAVQQGALVFNVKDYGAKGDGSTDDTSSIQSTINAATTGSVVFFPSGTYIVSSTIQLKAFCRFVGTHRQLAVIKMANNADLDAVLASQEWLSTSGTAGSADGPIDIEHLGVNGNKANQTGGQGNGIVVISYWNNLTDLEIDDTFGHGLKISGSRRDGTQITGTAVETHISRVDVRSAGGIGIYVSDPNGAAYDVTTDGWIIDSIVDTPAEEGIHIDAGGGWLVSGNHLYGCPVNAININNAFNTRVTNNYIESWGRSTTVGSYAAIALGDGNGSFMGSNYGSIISNNTIYSSGGAASGSSLYGVMSVASSSVALTQLIISNNAIYNFFSFWYAIYLGIQSGGTGAFNVSVSGNEIQGWMGEMSENPSSGTITVTGDTFKNGLAAAATRGFAHLPGVAGMPSGTPADTTRGVPIVVDTASAGIYGYISGAWQTVGSGGSPPPSVITAVRSAIAPTGQYLVTANAGTTGTSAGAWSLGLVYLTPLQLQASQTFTGLSTNLNAQAAGGTSPLIIMGLYNDVGNGTEPTGSPISGSQVSFNPVTQATGNVDIAFTSPLTLTAGTYWAAWVLTSGSALTTNPTMVTLAPLGNTVLTTLANSSQKGWMATAASSATTLPSSISPYQGYGGWPVIGLKAQ